MQGWLPSHSFLLQQSSQPQPAYTPTKSFLLQQPGPASLIEAQPQTVSSYRRVIGMYVVGDNCSQSDQTRKYFSYHMKNHVHSPAKNGEAWSHAPHPHDAKGVGGSGSLAACGDDSRRWESRTHSTRLMPPEESTDPAASSRARATPFPPRLLATGVSWRDGIPWAS